MVVFQAVAWSSREDDDSYTIDIFGRTEDGQSVHVETPFEPYFFVKVPLGKAPPVISTMIGRPVIIKRKDLWGFQNSHEYDFAKLTFRNESDMRRAEWMCRNQKYAVYEANLNSVLRLMHRTGVQSTGWLETHGTAVSTSTCSIDIRVGDWRSLKPVERDDIAPLRIASLDIECFSEDGSFPSAMKTTDVCFQVAITTRTYGRDEVQRKVLCVKPTDCPDSESFSCERDMLERFAEYMRDEVDPDIVTGWNIFGFDLEYLYTRTVLCGCSDTAYVWGRMRETPIELKTKVLASSALGSNTLKMVPMLGRYVFDMFQDIKREHKLESYSLNAVSTHFLNDKKIDMPVREMFSRFREGDSKKLGEVALYCLKDTELPHHIAQKTCLIENLIEMAKATWVPLSYLSERGQQIKVFSQVCRKARELGFMVPTLRVEKGAPETEYQGATVLEAQTGAYYMPITALDFASLYPSIMRAHNLCYSTWVDPKTPQFLNLPGVTYERYGTNVFAQNTPSLLPVILNELATFRKKAKKDMAKAEGTPMEAVYNGKQLAYKMSMNSVYGFTGASKGMLPLLAIASSVTMRGRQMIEETKNYVEANFPGAKVRYGDSVMPGTPVLVRENGIVKMKSIDELSSPACWEAYPGFWRKGTDKNSLEIYNTDAWTHQGWQPIKRVIRHKCQKKIYRILTHTGLVDVTEDHSLLTPNLELVKPGEVWEGRKLFHSWPDDISSWSGRPDGLEVNFGGEYDPFFKLFDTKESLQAKYPKKQCFLLTRKDAQIVYMKLIKLGYNVSLNVNPDNNAVQINWTESSFRRDPEAIKKIEVLHESWDGYVYDLETDAGTFQAGVGQMIVKNTDSVMVEFDVQGRKGQEAIEYSWKLGEQAAEQCTKLFKAPNDLELEKVYCPYFLYSKKRYAAKMYEKKGNKVVFKKIDIKGLQVVRRDTCPYVRNILKKLLTLILDSNDPRPAIEYARESAKSLLLGKAVVQELVMSKQLGAEYKTKQPHVEVRNKIRARAPGSEPQNGDRVPFLITHGSGGVNLCHKAEDPSYVIENKVPIDFLYYFEHQLQKPVCDLLEPLVGQRAFETIFRSVEYLTSRSITSYFTSRESRETSDHP